MKRTTLLITRHYGTTPETDTYTLGQTAGKAGGRYTLPSGFAFKARGNKITDDAGYLCDLIHYAGGPALVTRNPRGNPRPVPVFHAHYNSRPVNG